MTTLIIHAKDDPVVSFDHVDWKTICKNKNIITLFTKRGGHSGWYENMLLFGDSWADRVCGNFISALLETHYHTNFLIRALQFARKNKHSTLNYSMFNESKSNKMLGPKALARICSSSDIPSWGSKRESSFEFSVKLE